MVLIWSEWLQHVSHSQRQAQSLPSLSFIPSCFFFLPHISPSSHSSTCIPPRTLSAVIYYSSISHFSGITVGAWVDPGIPHLGMEEQWKEAGGHLISRDLFQSFEGGKLWRCMRVERNENPRAPNPGRSTELYMPGLYQRHVPRRFSLSKLWKSMYASKQSPTSEDGLKRICTYRD